MKPRHRYKPYVRRANGKERSESFRTAIRLAFYRELGKPFWVMVQRGWPNLAIECGATAADVRGMPLLSKLFGFQVWANRLKQQARGERLEPLEKAARRLIVKHYKLKRRRLRRA